MYLVIWKAEKRHDMRGARERWWSGICVQRLLDYSPQNVTRHHRAALLFHGLTNYISHGYLYEMKAVWSQFSEIGSRTTWYSTRQETWGITNVSLKLNYRDSEFLLLYYFSFYNRYLQRVADCVKCVLKLIHYVLPSVAYGTPGLKSIKPPLT